MPGKYTASTMIDVIRTISKTSSVASRKLVVHDITKIALSY
jgi:hypothetical protein